MGTTTLVNRTRHAIVIAAMIGAAVGWPGIRGHRHRRRSVCRSLPWSSAIVSEHRRDAGRDRGCAPVRALAIRRGRRRAAGDAAGRAHRAMRHRDRRWTRAPRRDRPGRRGDRAAGTSQGDINNYTIWYCTSDAFLALRLVLAGVHAQFVPTIDYDYHPWDSAFHVAVPLPGIPRLDLSGMVTPSPQPAGSFLANWWQLTPSGIVKMGTDVPVIDIGGGDLTLTTRAEGRSASSLAAHRSGSR